MTDSVGFSFQLQEYFSSKHYNFELEQPTALVVTVIAILIEFLTGVMLLINYEFPIARWGAFFISLFYFSLSLYPAFLDNELHSYLDGTIYANPVYVCVGALLCLFLIIFIFKKQPYVPSAMKIRTSKWVVFSSFIFALGLNYQVIRHLPIIDHTSYPTGSDFYENLRLSGRENDSIFLSEESIAEQLKENDTVVLPENMLLIYSFGLSKTNEDSWNHVETAIKKAQKKEYVVWGITSSGPEEIDLFTEEHEFDLNFLHFDKREIKYLVRSNPELVLVKDGIIIQKLHWLDAKKLNFD